MSTSSFVYGDDISGYVGVKLCGGGGGGGGHVGVKAAPVFVFFGARGFLVAFEFAPRGTAGG